MRRPMNPLWFFAKAAGITLIAVAGINHFMKKFSPKPSDLIAGTMHFRKGGEEFQKGFNMVFFGPEPPESRKPKEGSRIPID